MSVEKERHSGWLDALLKRRLLIHIGKGGVGRSTVSAALARLAAKRGKRVLVCEVNTKERMSSLLGGTPPSSFDTMDEVWQPQERIWAVNIKPWAGMKEYVSEVLRMRLVFNLVFENNVMRYFLRAVPGLQELVYIGKVWFHVTQTDKRGAPRFDLVIVDAPATGHGLAMLRIPQVVLDVTPAGPMRTAAQRIQDMLLDADTTWVNLVTLPEEMPVNETLELHQKLRDMLHLHPGVAWMNQWPMPVCAPEQEALLQAVASAGAQHQEAWPYFAAARTAQVIHEKALKHREQLAAHFDRPIVSLPRLSQSHDDEQKGVALMQDEMEQALLSLAPEPSTGD